MAVMVLDRFNGTDNPEDWISRAERYFTFLGFSEEHWLPLPSYYLDGEALEWFRWMFRNNQFFDWKHFKEKLVLRFRKRTYAKSPVVDAQITSILALLQKIEEKYSFPSQQVIVEDVRICATTACSQEIASPLAEANSCPVDNVEGHRELLDTFIDEHSGHVDNMFDEMSTGVFTKELEGTSSASILVGDLDDIPSTKVLDESVHSCCHKVVAEVQPDNPINMLDEEAPCLGRSEVQLFDECSPRNMSKSVDVHEAAMNLCVWDPGISFKFKALIDYTVNTKPLILLGSTSTFDFIAYANSVTQVWDPGQQRYEMVVRESKVDDTYYDVNRVFDGSSQRAASRELQLIAPLDIIRLPKLFRFLQQLLAQLIFVLQAPKSKVWYPGIGGDFSFRKKITEQASALKMEVKGKEVTKTICIAWLQGCIKSMADLIAQELRNFSMLAELEGLVDAQGVPASYATDFGLEFEFILVGYGADEFIILIMHYVLDPGDKIIFCPPIFSLYEVVALQTCENDHGSLYVIESELELVKVASVVVAYVVHKAMISESKSFSILVSFTKFKPAMRLMCYLAHLGGHRRVEECTIAQQVLKSIPVFKALYDVNAIQIKFSSHHGISVQIQFAKLGRTYGAAMRPFLIERSRAFLIIILEQNHHCFFLLCEVLMEMDKKCRLRGPELFSYLKQSYCLAGITDAHDSLNIKKVMKIVQLSKGEQVTIFRILASVMILSNMDLAKGNEIVSSILQVDSTWFHLRTTKAALYTLSSLERFSIILSVWLHSNLEDKVLIGAGGIVMNGPRPILAKQPNTTLSGYMWDPD